MAARIEDALVTVLVADAGVSALVGTRIGPEGAVGFSELPCGVFRRTARERVRHMTGESGLRSAAMAFWWLARDYDTAQACADAAESALQLYGGTVDVDGDDVVIERIFLGDDSDEPLELEEGDEQVLSRVLQRWTVWYRV